MSSLYWNITGQGNNDLVLLHGWGLNSEIWYNIIPQFTPYFRLHLVDLPGFGRSCFIKENLTLSVILKNLLPYLPSHFFILGWSLGGLVATYIALKYPHRVRALISVASSPCFTSRDNWPGMHPDVLKNIKNQLIMNFRQTVKNFLKLQMIGSKIKYKNLYQLQNIILCQPIPSQQVLESSLGILLNEDLRKLLPKLKMPILRLYGKDDKLVPHCISHRLDILLPHSSSIIMENTAHAPFISDPDRFSKYILTYLKELC